MGWKSASQSVLPQSYKEAFEEKLQNGSLWKQRGFHTSSVCKRKSLRKPAIPSSPPTQMGPCKQRDVSSRRILTRSEPFGRRTRLWETCGCSLKCGSWVGRCIKTSRPQRSINISRSCLAVTTSFTQTNLKVCPSADLFGSTDWNTNTRSERKPSGSFATKTGPHRQTFGSLSKIRNIV